VCVRTCACLRACPRLSTGHTHRYSFHTHLHYGKIHLSCLISRDTKFIDIIKRTVWAIFKFCEDKTAAVDSEELL
jgi:hypothetical protein